MPRRARMYLAGLPYHIVQRGNNREACFIEHENYQFYLDLLHEVSGRYGMSLHAYCLMTNHIHLLATPDMKTSISDTMKVVGSRYAQYINKKYNRTGTLWEGRHKSSLVQSEKYFLTCCRYIELNPVVANMVTKPEEYAWSSYHSNAWGEESWLKPHIEYTKLAKERERRCKAYRELFTSQIDSNEIVHIRNAVRYCLPTGDERFKHQIEKTYDLTFGQARRGRPKLEID